MVFLLDLGVDVKDKFTLPCIVLFLVASYELKRS